MNFQLQVLDFMFNTGLIFQNFESLNEKKCEYVYVCLNKLYKVHSERFYSHNTSIILLYRFHLCGLFLESNPCDKLENSACGGQIPLICQAACMAMVWQGLFVIWMGRNAPVTKKNIIT